MSIESKPQIYCIRIKEQLDPHWMAWLGNLRMEQAPQGETLIIGSFIDQSALHGLLARIRDMNLTLLAVTTVKNKSDEVSKEKGNEL